VESWCRYLVSRQESGAAPSVNDLPEIRNHSTMARSSGLLGSRGEGIREGTKYQVVSNDQDAVVGWYDLSLSQHATYHADDAARVLRQSSRQSTSSNLSPLRFSPARAFRIALKKFPWLASSFLQGSKNPMSESIIKYCKFQGSRSIRYRSFGAMRGCSVRLLMHLPAP